MESHRWDALPFYLLLALLIWLPLPFGSNTLWAKAVMQLLVFGTALVWVVGFVFGKVQVTLALRKAIPVCGAFVFVAGWVFAQQFALPLSTVDSLAPGMATLYEAAGVSTAYFSLDAFQTHSAFLQTLALLLIFTLTLLTVNSTDRLRWLLWCAVIGGTFQALYGALSTLSGLEIGFFVDKSSGKGVATGTFVNRNHLAGYLEMCLAMGVGLLIAQLSNQRAADWWEWLRNTLTTLMSSKVLLRVCLAIMVVAVVLTRSRMGNTAFFSSLMLTGLVYVILKRKLSRGVVILFASLILIDTLIVSNWFGLDKVVERIESSVVMSQPVTSEVTSSQPQAGNGNLQSSSAPVTILDVRTDVNPVSVQIIKNNPLTGTGAGTFYTALPMNHDGSWQGFFDFAHNDFLQFPLELGMPAFLLLAIAVIWCFIQALQAIRLRRNNLCAGAGFASIMGMLAIMIHSSVDFNLQIPANAAYFVVLMAISVLSRQLPVTRKQSHD
ncbi:O-antigen ligase family protein [Parendozoicomonas sp. Alg238-R29]|uniref:O-antigen ligase family protein n=1 Tax=Parendozoicomonas sp. Alg238-R29 TaxID=2993446 RepID=UPI00248D489A|nr:O-antigen ligase family protein [Parendozoicomonas sp. Alg238-R29]